jgi:putative transposase
MKTNRSLYHRHRFRPEIIQYAVGLYHRFSLSFRDVEDVLAERGITVSYETIRCWCTKFGPHYVRRLQKRQGGPGGDTWLVDEVFIRIRGQQCDRCRAIDQDGDVLDILVQRRRDTAAAARFLPRLLKGQGRSPRRLVTDKLRSYPAAHRAVMPEAIHDTERYSNNLAEVCHQPTRQRESQMRRFKSIVQAQRFLTVHGIVRNLFRLGRHLLQAKHYRLFRLRAFARWETATLL